MFNRLNRLVKYINMIIWSLMMIMIDDDDADDDDSDDDDKAFSHD